MRDHTCSPRTPTKPYGAEHNGIPPDQVRFHQARSVVMCSANRSKGNRLLILLNYKSWFTAWWVPTISNSILRPFPCAESLIEGGGIQECYDLVWGTR